MKRRPAFAMILATVVATWTAADAKGTVVIRQRDGDTKTYNNVVVMVRDQAMAVISADGRGRIVLGKAGCLKIGELVRCTAYEATLDQYGRSKRIPLVTGTVWLNPTKESQPLTHTSQRLPPRGVLGSFETTKGTYVSLTGTVDEVQK